MQWLSSAQSHLKWSGNMRRECSVFESRLHLLQQGHISFDYLAEFVHKICSLELTGIDEVT